MGDPDLDPGPDVEPRDAVRQRTVRTTLLEHGARLQIRRCKLECVEGPDAGKTLVSDKEQVRIGSQRGCDFVLSDPTASRQHFEILHTDRGYLVADLNSTNGIFLEGRRVERAYLTPGSKILAGQTALLFSPLEEELTVEPDAAGELCGLIGTSPRMRQLFGLLRKVAPMDLPVVITGETGTGKERVAAALHALSARSKGPFVVVDCGALPPHQLESELFGHDKGAFPGALAPRAGAFERASGGTLFLDAVDELRLEVQPKLLRVLENRELRRLGGDEVIDVDVRVVAATRRELLEGVDAGTFRDDLYFRLSVLQLQLPPLRERREDLPLLLRLAAEERKSFTGAALHVLQHYPWPGNVRELFNVVAHAATLAEGATIDVPHLPARIRGATPDSGLGFNEHLAFKDAKEQLLEAFEREYLTQLLRRCEGNISRAARESGLHRKSIERLIKKYQLDARALRAR